MGETGCGKTVLVNFLSQTLEIPLLTLDVDGGKTDEDVIEFMDRVVQTYDEQSEDGNGVLVFFDDINVANCMGLFKTLIIDRMHRSVPLPHNIRLIMCCKPYRLRNHEFEATDPMRRLVHRVHPLPESVIDVVNDLSLIHI